MIMADTEPRFSHAADLLQGRILIVDDKPTNIMLLERTLRRAGYVSIMSTSDPGEVCALHRQHCYDLILLDLLMPGMDGYAVMDGLREIEAGGYLPVLVVTALPDEMLNALRAGAKDFVSRPFMLAELLARVHNMLEVRLGGRLSGRKMERDLVAAGSTQVGMLPKTLHAPPNYALAAFSRPADQTGGDIYDVIPMGTQPSASLALLLADVSGHGIAPALSVVEVRSMLRLGVRMGMPLGEVVREIDAQLMTDLADDRFVTAFIGQLDPVTHCLRYHAAGQGPLLHYHSRRAEAEWRGACDIPLGVAARSSRELTRTMFLEQRDMIVLLTDGFYEATSPDGEAFSAARVLALVKAHEAEGPSAVLDALVQAVVQFGGDAAQEDDLTAIVIQRV